MFGTEKDAEAALANGDTAVTVVGPTCRKNVKRKIGRRIESDNRASPNKMTGHLCMPK